MDITFECDGCGQDIVIDEAGAGSVVECPKCRARVLVPDKQTPTTSPRKAERQTVIVEKIEGLPLDVKIVGRPGKPGTLFLSVGCILMFLIGLGMIVGAFLGDMGETHPEAGAIRQIVHTLEYGFGFAIMLLSMILAALVRLIRGEVANPK